MSKEHQTEIGQNESTTKSHDDFSLVPFVVFGIIIYVLFITIRGFFRKLTYKVEDITNSIQLPVFTTENIGRNYIALGMVQSSSVDEASGLKELKRQAIAMNADAIVGMNMNISNNVSGKVSSSLFSGKHTSGRTTTKTTYHYTGTAVKFNESSTNE